MTFSSTKLSRNIVDEANKLTADIGDLILSRINHRATNEEIMNEFLIVSVAIARVRAIHAIAAPSNLRKIYSEIENVVWNEEMKHPPVK